MGDRALDHFVAGCIAIVAGLVVLFFNEDIRRWVDYWYSKDFPFGYGKMWAGDYTSGYVWGVVIILVLGCFAFGIYGLIAAFR